MYDIRHFNENKHNQLCEASTDEIFTADIFTIKELVIMESSIAYFYQDLYIPSIKKLGFLLTHVRIIGTHHCGNTRQEAFQRR